MSTTLKFALLLFGAAVLALAARMLFANAAGRHAPAVQTVQIRAAAASLPAGLLLRADDLDWVAMDKAKLPQNALVKGSHEAESLAGGLIRRNTAAGAPILATDVIRPDAPGFLAAALKPGMRAVSVPVDNVSGNAGLIQPGDYVDMILVQESKSHDGLDSGRARSVVSETVVEKVRVIAVGSVFQSRADDSKANRQPARTVTIEVMPRAAEAVTVAARLGTLSMALRSFAVTDRAPEQDGPTQSIVAWDNTQPKSAPVWASDVSRALGARPPANEVKAKTDAAPARAAPYQINILRGAKRDTQALGGAD